MAQQVKASIELETGKKLTHYRSLVIEQDLFRHHRFEIVVPFEVLENEDESFFNKSHTDVCGKRLTISFEPVLENGSFEFQFKGIITEISLSNQCDLSNVFVIKGYSPTVLMEDCALRRTFLNKNMQQIFDTVLTGYPGNIIKKQLKPKDKKTIKYIVQYDETNYQFLNRIAAENGEWFYYNGKDLLLGEPESAKEVEFDIDGIQSFDMSVALMPAKFMMTAYDYTKHQTYNGRSGSQAVEGLSHFGKFALDESENLFNQESLSIAAKPVYNQNELDELIKSRRSAIANNMVVFHGRGENPDISVGSVVNVNGIKLQTDGRSSKENFGKYRVTDIRHQVDTSGNYSSVFKAVPETAKVPPVNPYCKQPVGQPELATVTDNNDPDKLSRVKVEFNWPGDDKESDWIRVGTFYAGDEDGKGMQFIPEKEAQVVIGYELNKPELPFIITSLYPKKHGMRSLKGSNDEKAIYTKAGNLVELNDKPGENKILITNSNKEDTSIELEFKDNGVISLKTNGKVQIEAQETISLNAAQKISLTAQHIEIKAQNNLTCEGRMKTNISGMEIKLEAETNAEIKSSAQLKLSGLTTDINSDTVLSIKGTLVKIN